MNRAAILLSIALLAACTAVSLAWGIADLFSLRPDGAMDERPLKMPQTSRLAHAFSIAATAHELDPANPVYLENMARIRYWQAGRLPDSARRHAMLGESLMYAGEAAVLRPVSPYAWASLMQARLELGRVDAEFARDMNNAAMLGPWEPEIQVAIAEAGLDAWAALTARDRKIVLDDFARGYRMQPGKMTEIALKRRCGRPGHVCS